MTTKVEGDIDIEEHDVLDNLQNHNLVPDLSCVKDEAPDEEIQASSPLLLNGAPEAMPANSTSHPTSVFELVQASLTSSDLMNYNLHPNIRTKTAKRRSKAQKSKPRGRFRLVQTRIDNEPVLVCIQSIKEEVQDPEIRDLKIRGPKSQGPKIRVPKNPGSKTRYPKLSGAKIPGHTIIDPKYPGSKIRGSKTRYPKLSGPKIRGPKNPGSKITGPKIPGSKIGKNPDTKIPEPVAVCIQSDKEKNPDSEIPDPKISDPKTREPEIPNLSNPDPIESSETIEAIDFDPNEDITSDSVLRNPSENPVDEAASDIDNVEMQKIISSFVHLEDWGPRLKDSPGFCTECETLFSTSNDLLAHNKTAHAEIDEAEMRKIKSAFVSLEDVGALLKAAKNVPPVTYKCIVCHAVILGYKLAKLHRVKHHPDRHNTKIFERINTKAKDNIPSNDQKLPIPISVLFQCSKCSVHFVSCTAANLHLKVCQNDEGAWKCHICERSFRSEDQKKHLLQHGMNSEPFNVYLSGDDMLDKVLNKCPDCKTFLHESSFRRHCSTACKGDSVICTICKLDIHSSSIEEHYKWHYRTNLSDKKEFIIVEYAETENRKEKQSIGGWIPVKRKMEDMSEDAKTKWKKFDENAGPIKVYYCVNCGFYSIGCLRSKHAEGICHTMRVKKKFICKTCGLTSRSNHMHQTFHASHPNLTILDMQFLRADTDELIAPPMPPFRKCNKCDVQYCRRASEKLHDCKDSYRFCKICSKLFSELAFKLHLPFHQYAYKISQSQNATPSETSSAIETKNVTPRSRSQSPQPEPNEQEVLKSEALPNLWNILYRCRTCNIICDDYDQSVEHSQKHFNNTESQGVVVKYCEICCLKFDGTCYDRHQQLHAQNLTLKKESFKIVTYKHSKVFTQHWFYPIITMFGKEKEQIIANSIYLHSRKVKMRVVQDGDPEALMVKCCKCELFIKPSSVYKHYLSKSCNKYRRSFVCKFCKFRFNTQSAKYEHCLLHKKFKRFKIVFFNEEGDDSLNELFSRKCTRAPDLDKTKNIRYYKCESCKRCYAGFWKEIKRHTCSTAPRRRCEKCDLCFDHRAANRRHQRLHELNPQLNKDDIRIIRFIPKSVSKTEEGIIVSPDQMNGKDKRSSVTNQTPINKEVVNNETENGVHKPQSNEEDKQSNGILEKVRDTTTAKNYAKPWSSCEIIYKEESLKKINLKTYSNKLFKCRVCKAHLIRAKTLWYHVRNRHFKVLEKCDICGYSFSGTTLVRHRYIHHEQMKLKREDFVIIESKVNDVGASNGDTGDSEMEDEVTG